MLPFFRLRTTDKKHGWLQEAIAIAQKVYSIRFGDAGVCRRCGRVQ
jgi:hypothetical protein